ncbi:hypothetical protein L207DRAFT_565003 [Hyaloscypha variabilis F]|uniref:CBM1 domain-containing protein n=1 Tax=Hyaloscypha variabilis (strain UAMH 11265 / GT02V1 / F) TaxID=1149755 RepID=A0A2J6RW92_HYAVF|nr:hypothetical protein L207DRAFT_565003 [Hyaloscypha variabilis F]
MLFSRYSLASLLALTNSVLSQVVVTVTDTVSVITVTVPPPKTTSTSTKYVTVTAHPPPTSSKTTVTVTQTTILSSVPSSDNCVVAWGGQCDGDAYNGCNNCDDGLNCTFYTSK